MVNKNEIFLATVMSRIEGGMSWLALAWLSPGALVNLRLNRLGA